MPEPLFQPPYYAVIFASVRRDGDDPDYAATAARMVALAKTMPGYLGIESVHDPASREGITVSYWRDLDSITAWKAQVDHAEAQRHGRERWYDRYALRVARVEREYDFTRR
jgi:heme-degrading monooxygenase HmoA